MSAEEQSLTRGPNALVEQVLSGYGLDIDSLPADLIESDTQRLLLALLIEQRGGESITSAAAESASAANPSQTVVPDYRSVEATATTETEKVHDLEFEASTLSVRGFSSPIFVAFEEPSSGDVKIQLDPNDGDEPFVVSPGDGFSFEEVYIGRPSGSSDTSVTVEVFE